MRIGLQQENSSWPQARSLLGRLARRSNGQNLVEFAVIAPVFFLLVFGTVDLSRLYYTQATLQHALREAGRFAVTGEKLDKMTRIESIIYIAKQVAVGMDLTGIQISSALGGLDHAGGPGETVTISILYNFRFITPLVGQFFNGGHYQFRVATTFKNEPFPAVNTE